MREEFDIPDNICTRVWNKYMSNTYELLKKPSDTLQNTGMYPGQVVVIEEQNPDGTWPRESESKR